MRHTAAALLALATAGTSLPGLAQQTTSSAPVARTEPDWHFTLGAAAVIAPTYEGSNSYKTSPWPVAEATWRDTLSIGTRDGVVLKVKPGTEDGGLTFKAGLNYWFGRKEGADKDHGDALRGMGDIDGAPVASIGFEYQLLPFFFEGNLSRDIGGDRDGTSATGKVGYALYNTERLHVRTDVSTTWADNNYMQSMFGVTAQQSASSERHYSQYTADSGLKDVSFGIGATYDLTDSFAVGANVGYKRLVDEAADSPLVKEGGSANQFVGGISAIYKF
ncbi:MipA/OmpV family protein [Radicibacter daui]|uniref:MipA/OmpV family protein n=1 Tax=Radicibacter daui TaxID=3064829 RepID=UPI004046E540